MKDLQAVIKRVVAYRDAHGWQRNDKPNNIAKSIVVEAAELLENYQWSHTPASIENVKEELADILMYAFAMVHDEGIDIERAIEHRLEAREKGKK